MNAYAPFVSFLPVPAGKKSFQAQYASMSTFIDTTRIAVVYKSPLEERLNSRNDCLVYDSIGHRCFMYLTLLGIVNSKSLIGLMSVSTR